MQNWQSSRAAYTVLVFVCNRLVKHFQSYNLPVERIISVDDNVQMSEFFDGEMVHPHQWTDEALFRVGKIAAQLHSAAESFIETEADIWQPWCLREIGGNHRIHVMET